MMKTADEILDGHGAVCAELMVLMTEESQLLSEGKAPTEAMLARKQALLPQLDASVDALKALNAVDPTGTAGQKAKVAKLRKQSMRLFLLDRENEKQLRQLQNAQRRPAGSQRRGTARQAQAAYAANLRA